VIPARHIRAWSRVAPWLTEEQIEQDLVLSRLIVEIANHPMLGEELVFRGGTCLHKVVLPEPLRYSEDLDYVRASHGPIGPLLDAIREVADRLDMDVNTDVGSYPKARLRAPFETGSGLMRVKIEINTYETSPAGSIGERLTASSRGGGPAPPTCSRSNLRSWLPRSCGHCSSARKAATSSISGWRSPCSGSTPPGSWRASTRTDLMATPPSEPARASRNTSTIPASAATSPHC